MVSDVGSTKLALEQARRDPRFVGGHPLAGSHTAGVEHAREDLFEGATWYLCPADKVTERLYERLQGLVVRFGAQPIPIDADMHDRLMATVSQLPHVLANVLVEQLLAASRDDDRPAPARPLGVGPSFRDATRVAGSNTAIWTDIYLANREALIDAIERTMRGLEQVRGAAHPGRRRRAGGMERAGSCRPHAAVGGRGAARQRRHVGLRADEPTLRAIRPAHRRADRAAGQGDLPPGGDARRDGGVPVADRELPARGGHDLDAQRGARARGARRGASRGGRGARNRPARGARSGWSAGRGQRRHADAPAARLAGRTGGSRVHARRRRVDPPPPDGSGDRAAAS